MATRTKQVLPPGMVAHLWAHQAQEHARVSSGNFYFDGDTIYSYGNHFPIARIVKRKGKEDAVLMTTRTYSATTRGHVRCAEGACRHMTTFHVARPADVGKAARCIDMYDYRKRQALLVSQYKRARGRKPEIFRQIEALTEEANAFSKFFGLRRKLSMPKDEGAMADECKRIAAVTDRRIEALNEKREAARCKSLAAALALWVAGADSGHLSFYALPVRLRIANDKLETSHGAVVSAVEATKALRILRRIRAKAETYKRNGGTISIGPFDLHSMDEDGTVKVGCHTIEWVEIERVAALAGV